MDKENDKLDSTGTICARKLNKTSSPNQNCSPKLTTNGVFSTECIEYNKSKELYIQWLLESNVMSFRVLNMAHSI